MKIILVLMLLLGACGEPVKKDSTPVFINNGADAGNQASDAGTTTDTSVSLPDATSTPGGPEILELSANVMRLTQGQSLAVSALVTDPDGLDDIVGGRLLDSVSMATFGNFTGSGGSYSFDLSWNALDQVSPIDFVAEEDRVFTAEFVDTTGNRATQSLRLTLHCDGEPACAGACGARTCGGSCRPADEFLYDVLNCGSCGKQCGNSESCVDGVCACDLDVCGNECVDLGSDQQHCGICNRRCAAGEACVSGACRGDGNAAGPCVDESDCPAPGSCLDQNSTGVPGGVCLYLCSSDTECPGAARCATYQETLQLCTSTCTSSADCRPEFSCQQSAEGFLACGPPL